jgi:hypothetical protein
MKTKAAGITPTTVYGSPSILTALAEGLPAAEERLPQTVAEDHFMDP